MMRKTDYEAIARNVNGCRQAHVPQSPRTNAMLDDLSRSIADYCATRDTTFRRELFLRQCGVAEVPA